MSERVAAVDEALGPRGPGQLRCDCVEARDGHPAGVSVRRRGAAECQHLSFP